MKPTYEQTIKMLEERLARLIISRDQALTQYHLQCGAIEDCEQILTYLKTDRKEG